jgi:hypothetical protein
LIRPATIILTYCVVRLLIGSILLIQKISSSTCEIRVTTPKDQIASTREKGTR